MAITGKKSNFLDDFKKATLTLDPALAKKSEDLRWFIEANRVASDSIAIVPDTGQRIRQWSVYDKLKMRLNLNVVDVFGEGVHVNIFNGPNTVFVFAAKGDKAEMFDDDVNLYPSDSLIGRFRLFLEAVK